MKVCKYISSAILVLAIIAIMILTASFDAHAEEVESASDWASEVMTVVDSHEHGDVKILYTADSVLQSGIYSDITLDILSKQVYFNIDTKLPVGYVIYDDPATEYIDGIRLNGATVTAYKVPIDYTQDIDYEVIVKIVYADGFTGALAQMSDGTYNWFQLLENPIGLLMAMYYVFATLSVVVGMIVMWRGKNKKVKTANEISKAVEERASAAATAVIDEKVLPVVTSFQNTAQSLVKAFALTTSKSKEAPVALLDVLQSVSSTDSAAAIEQAKALIAQNKLNESLARNEIVEKLHDIAHTSQEVARNENPEHAEEDTPPIF